jgi:hypothetical protein
VLAIPVEPHDSCVCVCVCVCTRSVYVPESRVLPNVRGGDVCLTVLVLTSAAVVDTATALF